MGKPVWSLDLHEFTEVKPLRSSEGVVESLKSDGVWYWGFLGWWQGFG